MNFNQEHFEVAILACGCFWGVEEILRKVPGVQSTQVGYTGGTTKNPTYEDVCGGQTGHAEAVRVIFDPAVISYEEILKYFFRLHDPTQENGQGNDIGSQYRSTIFYHSEEQKNTATRVKSLVSNSRFWPGVVVTEIIPAQEFYVAEDFHQKYLEKNPNGYTCHFLRPAPF